jgi:3-phosphoshikimate 1-carboxyvinyltransferase
MMAAIASTVCENPVTITGAEAVSKSYPGFFEDFEKLGGALIV